MLTLSKCLNSKGHFHVPCEVTRWKPLDDPPPHGKVCKFSWKTKVNIVANTIIGDGWSLRRGLDRLSFVEPRNWVSFEQRKNIFSKKLVFYIDLFPCCNILIIQTLPKVFIKYGLFFIFLASWDKRSINLVMQHSKWVSTRTTTFQLARWTTR